MIENLSTLIPVVAITSAISGFLGWSMRSSSKAPSSTAKPSSTADGGKQERVKNLEAALEKSRASLKTVKTELEALQTASVSKASLDSAVAELDTAKNELNTVGRRISSLEADLKKSQETVKNLNNRSNEIDKAQKDRSFTLENELSKTREHLAILQNRPNDSAGLQAEIERLRESVVVSTRYAGEMRKRESIALEALEKTEARLSEAKTTDRPSAPRKIGPVADSGRIAAAKAEVLRLLEQNKQKAAASELEPSVKNDVTISVEDSDKTVESFSSIEQGSNFQATLHPPEKINSETENLSPV